MNSDPYDLLITKTGPNNSDQVIYAIKMKLIFALLNIYENKRLYLCPLNPRY